MILHIDMKALFRGFTLIVTLKKLRETIVLSFGKGSLVCTCTPWNRRGPAISKQARWQEAGAGLTPRALPPGGRPHAHLTDTRGEVGGGGGGVEIWAVSRESAMIAVDTWDVSIYVVGERRALFSSHW